MVRSLHDQNICSHLQGAVEARQTLVDAGFAEPSWEDLARGLRPAITFNDDDPTTPKHGWQDVATWPVYSRFIDTVVWPRLSESSRAMLRSQSGPLASVPFTCCPVARHTTFDTQVFPVLLLRRLWLPLPSSSRVCQCGRPPDVSGHHRAACAVAGVLGSRGFAVGSAAARVCREQESDDEHPDPGHGHRFA